MPQPIGQSKENARALGKSGLYPARRASVCGALVRSCLCLFPSSSSSSCSSVIQSVSLAEGTHTHSHCSRLPCSIAAHSPRICRTVARLRTLPTPLRGHSFGPTLLRPLIADDSTLQWLPTRQTPPPPTPTPPPSAWSSRTAAAEAAAAAATAGCLK